jgi:hypothetical protein
LHRSRAAAPRRALIYLRLDGVKGKAGVGQHFSTEWAGGSENEFFRHGVLDRSRFSSHRPFRATPTPILVDRTILEAVSARLMNFGAPSCRFLNEPIDNRRQAEPREVSPLQKPEGRVRLVARPDQVRVGYCSAFI